MMWKSWPGTGYPASKYQEAVFVSDMRREAGDNKIAGFTKWTQQDRIAVITILRSGTTLKQALAIAPGLDVTKMLAAYNDINNVRKKAYKATYDYLDSAINNIIEEDKASVASILAPELVREITKIAASKNTTPESRSRRLLEIKAKIEAVAKKAEILEGNFRKLPQKQVLDYLKKLYDPTDLQYGVFASRYFIPNRVSVLSPVQVTQLLNSLGEKSVDQDTL